MHPCQQQGSLCLPDAEKLLYKLSKHFALKVPVKFDLNHASISFHAGECEIQREGQRLEITCRAESREQLEQVSQIISSHVALMVRDPAVQLNWVLN